MNGLQLGLLLWAAGAFRSSVCLKELGGALGGQQRTKRSGRPGH